MSRIRIVQILSRLDFGGAELSTLYAVRNLNRSLFEVQVIAGPGGEFDSEAGKMNIPLRFCGELSREVRPLADLDTFDQLRTILREIKPDIVHTHGGKAGIAGRLAAAAIDIPIVMHTYHGFGFHKYQPEGAFRLTVALDRETNRRSNHLVFVCHANEKTAEVHDLIQNCSTSVIRTGVELEPLLQAQPSEGFREQYGLTKKSKIVAWVGALKPQKDPLTFVEAASLVVKKLRSARFLLFGNGELAEAVSRRTRKVMPASTMIQAGWSRNVPEVLANADVLVLPSLWEGLPRIIPEATITGLPVVASRVDGVTEVVEEGRNGMLAEPQNPEDFAEKILTVIEAGRKVDEDLSRQIQYEYDIRETVRHHESLYLELAAAQGIKVTEVESDLNEQNL